MSLDWLGKAFDFLKDVARRETTTMPGLINLSFLVLITLGIFVVGSVEAMQALVRAIRGEAGPGFPPIAIVVGDMVLMVFCVTILIVAERLKASGN